MQNPFKETFTETSRVIHQTGDAIRSTGQAFEHAGQRAGKAIYDTEKEVEEYWHILGPGLTTGASDDDPSGIATYSQAGAVYGFGLIWMSLFTLPLMSVVQEMCARIGMVTGQGLAANIRRYYSRPVLYVCTILLLAANIFNIGADLGAMAEGLRLLAPSIPFGLIVVFFGIASLFLQVYTSYESYAKYLKYLALVLLAYVVSALMISIDWGIVLNRTIVPSFTLNKETLIMIAAILGTTISPYLFFWQTSQEVEEKIKRHSKVMPLIDEIEVKTFSTDTVSSDSSSHVQNVVQMQNSEQVQNLNVSASPSIGLQDQDLITKKDIRNMRVDVWTGMFISNLVMFFIIAASAATLNVSGITDIKSASDAAEALRPFAGDFAFVLFAIGIIGTGMLAIPVLAGSAAYAVSESFGWKFGLYRKLKEAYAFYGVIALATIVGIILNFIGLDPIKALIYSAVGNGLVAPIILFLIVSMSSRSDIMGESKNGISTRIIGWITVILMSLVALATLIVSFY